MPVTKERDSFHSPPHRSRDRTQSWYEGQSKTWLSTKHKHYRQHFKQVEAEAWWKSMSWKSRKGSAKELLFSAPVDLKVSLLFCLCVAFVPVLLLYHFCWIGRGNHIVLVKEQATALWRNGTLCIAITFVVRQLCIDPFEGIWGRVHAHKSSYLE